MHCCKSYKRIYVLHCSLVGSKSEHQIDSKHKLMTHQNYLLTTATIFKNLLKKIALHHCSFK